MKQLLILCTSILFMLTTVAQNCIDFLVLQMDPNDNVKDTLFCKILNEDENNVIIDNGYAITTLPKSVVIYQQKCVREMTVAEMYKYEGINGIDNENFSQSNSPGAFLRKAAIDTYISTCLAIVGAGGVVLGATLIDNNIGKTITYAVGGVAVAASLFFVIKAWNEIYKAGKLMDINESVSLSVNPNRDGIGISLNF